MAQRPGSAALGEFTRVARDAASELRDFIRVVRAAEDAVDVQRAASASPVSEAVSDAGGGAAGAAEEIAQRVRAAIATSASGGFRVFTGRVLQEFDRVGGTIITMSRRIDSAMKFPALDAALTSAASGLGRFGVMVPVVFAKLSVAIAKSSKKLYDYSPLASAAAAGVAGAVAVLGVRYGLLASAASLAGAAVVKIGQAAFRTVSYLGSVGDVAGKTFTKLFHIGTLGVFDKQARQARTAGGAIAALNSPISSTIGAMKSLGKEIAVALGVFGLVYKAVGFISGGIKAASDLNETVSASKQVFGESFDQIDKFTSGLQSKYGLSKKAQLEAANAFGSIAQSAGIAGEESAFLAAQFVQLGGDLASFKNLSPEEAFQKLRSALAGESEPLRQYGVLISEADVKTRAAAMGIASASGELSAQAKIMARASLIEQQLAAASGDLARTQDSAANQFRKAGGGIEEFQARIGQLLLPSVQAGTSALNDFLGIVLDVFEGSLPVVTGWFSYVQTAFAFVGRVVRNFGDYFEIAKIRVGAFGAYLVSWLEVLPQNFLRVTDWIGANWMNMLRDVLDGSAAAFSNLLDNAQRFGQALWDAFKGNAFSFTWKPLLDGFQAATEKFPEMVKPAMLDVEATISQIYDRIDRREAERMKGIESVAKKSAGFDAAPKGVDPQFAKVAEIGTKEGYSALIRGTLGGGKDDSGKKTAKNTERMVAEQKATKDAILRLGSTGAAVFTFGVQ